MNVKPGIIVFLFVLASLSWAGSALAQSDATTSASQDFSQAQLDQMLAPVALYPDELLTQVLTASTYPLEIVQAARWAQANPDLTGTDAVNAVDEQNWDPSVKAMLAFPDLLQMMDDKLGWTEQLGNAFLAQQAQVMDTVQGLRQKAEAAGTLTSGGELRVEDADGLIDIEPAASDLTYLPYYDPTTIYGNWWWPTYPPVFWAAWPGYYWQGGFAWGTGVAIGAGFFLTDFDWHHHCIDVHPRGRPWHGSGGIAGDGPSHVWQHNPAHRRGVAYRDPALNRQFGRANIPAGVASAFGGRGREIGPAYRSVPMQRSFAAPGMRGGFVAPREIGPAYRNVPMQRSVAAPGMRGGFVAPRGHGDGGGGRMALPRGSGGGGSANTQRAPARSDGSPNHRR